MTVVQVCFHGLGVLQVIFDTRDQGWTYAGCQVAMATKFYRVAINSCRFTVRNLLHVTRMGPRILSWRLDFWTLSATLLMTKELSFTDILGLRPYSMRDTNYSNRQCVKMLNTWSGSYKKQPCFFLSRFYGLDGKRNKYEQAALMEWYWQ